MSSSSAPMMAEAVIVHEDSEASDISDHRKVNAVPVGTTAKSLSKAGKGEKGNSERIGHESSASAEESMRLSSDEEDVVEGPPLPSVPVASEAPAVNGVVAVAAFPDGIELVCSAAFIGSATS